MKNIKQTLYGIIATALLTAPAVAGAQWATGKSNAQGSGLPSDSVYLIIQRIMNWLLGIVGFIAIIGFVISGILYLTAAGDEDQIEKAKSAMIYSIIGVLVALLGYVVVNFVVGLLTPNVTTF